MIPPPKALREHPGLVHALTLLLMGMVLAADLVTPLGVAGGVPYVAPVLLSLLSPRPGAVLIVSGACTLLTGAGFFLSQPHDELWMVLVNRSYALFAIWIVAIVGSQWQRAHRDLAEAYAEVEDQVNERTAQLAQANAHLERESTERRRTAERAEQHWRRLQAVLDASPVGIMVATSQGEFSTMNEEAERLLGADTGPLRYLRADGLEYDVAQLPVQRALCGEHVQSEEIRICAQDGRVTPVLVSAVPLAAFEEERVTEAIVVAQDITPLENVERLRSEFLGMVGHEFKTPLTAIKGVAASALHMETLPPEELEEFWDIVDKQADRLNGLVQDLLDMARIEAGRFAVSSRPQELRPLLDEASRVFARAGGRHPIAINVPAGVPPVVADAARVVQVVTNLLSNAAKFSPATEPISIGAGHRDEVVTVCVVDHGTGIPPEKLPHLFRKFTQVHEDEGDRVGGTGLGLAICKGIVEAHGGKIWAESGGRESGSRFNFTLPAG